MQISNKLTMRPRQKFLFTALSNLVITQKQSPVYEYLYFVCSEIQYIAILLCMQTSLLGYDKTNSLSIFIHKLSQILACRDFIEGKDMTSILSGCVVAIWIYFGYIILMISYIFYKVFKHQNLHERVQTWISSLFQFHAGCLFWVVNMILMTVVSMNLSGASFPKISTQEGRDNAIIGTQFVFLILNYGIGFIGAFFSFDPFCSTNLFAVRTCYFQFLGFFLKAILAPIFAFTSYGNIYSRVIFIIVALLISIARSISVTKDFPFYNYLPMKLARITTSVGIWISGTNINAIIWYENDLTTSWNLSYFIMLCLPIGVKLSLGIMNRLIEQYMIADPKTIHTERHIYGKLFAYRFLANKVSLSLNENKKIDKYEAYFLGDLKEHSKSCEDAACLCTSMKMNEKHNTEDNVSNTKKSLSTYLDTISILFLEEAIQRVKNKGQLQLVLAEKIFSKTVNSFSSSLMHLFQTFNQNMNLSTKIKRHLLIEKIQVRLLQYSHQSDSEKLDIVKFVDYEHDTTDFLSEIATTTNEYLNFWNTVKNPKFKMTDILLKSDQIEKTADRIDKLWKSLNEKHEPFYHQMKEPYRVYLSIVRNTPSVSSSEIKKLRWKNKPRDSSEQATKITGDDLSSSKVLSFSMSMMRERLGKVASMSENIQNCLGYTCQDIVGKSINIIMPPIFADKYAQVLLKQQFEKSKIHSQTKEYFTSTIYVKNKAGYVVPCSIYITICPYIQQELLYRGIIKILDTNFDFIITDSKGFIDSFTEGVGKNLSLSLEKKINIKEICIDIDKVLSNSKKSLRNSLSHQASGITRTSTQIESNNVDEDQKEEGQIKPAVLNFLKRNGSVKYVKYKLSLTQREVLDDTVFIFQMELVSENKQEVKAPKVSVKLVESDKGVSETDDSMEDIPIEGLAYAYYHPKKALKKTSDEEALSDSKENFDTPGTHKPLRKLIFERRTGRQSEMTGSNFDKKTESQIITSGSQLHVKVEAYKNMMTTNSAIHIEEEKIRNLRRGSIPTPVQHKQVAFVQSERGSTSSVKSNNLNEKLEQTIYTIPIDRTNYFLKAVIWVLVLISIALHIVLYTDVEDKLDFLKTDVSVMTTSTLRVYQITELNKRTRIFPLYQNGYIFDGRFTAFGINIPLLYVATLYITYISPNLSTYNNLVRTSIEKIEISLQEELFSSTTPVYLPDVKGVVNNASIFDAAAGLAVQAGKLALMNPFLVQKDNFQVNYILNNTLNEQLVVSEQVNDALLEDTDIKLESLKTQAIYFMIIVLLLSVMIMIYYGSNQFKFIQSRKKLIDLFLVLSDQEINQNMAQVEIFKNIVLNKGVNIEAAIEKRVSLLQGTVKGFNTRRRDTELKGINYRILGGALLFLLVIMIVLVPFLVLPALISAKKEAINKNVEIIVEANNYLCDMNLLSVAIYEYVEYNATTTIRGNPIEEEFQTIYTSLTATQEVFIDLLNDNLDKNNQVIDPELEALLSGNICTVVGIDASQCIMFGAGADKGIIGLSSYVLSAIKGVKAIFDASNRTFADGVIALNQAELIIVEGVYTIVQEAIFKKLGEILRVQAEEKITSMENSLKITAIVSSICAVLIGVTVAGFSCSLTEKERVRWRKLLRKIPFNIVLTNKAFKNYFAKELNHLLDSLNGSL